MVTSAVFLDRRVALRALLCMGRDPVGRFGIILALLAPHFYQLARCRLVIVQGASEAEVVFTEALDSRNNAVEVASLDGAVHGILAVRRWTPFEVVHVINIGSC